MFSFKSSHQRYSVKKVFLKISQENTVLESLLNKAAGLQACNFIKRRLQHRHFPVKFGKFLRTPIFEKYLRTTASVLSFSWHLCWSPFLIKLQVFRPATFLKRVSNTGVLF